MTNKPRDFMPHESDNSYIAVEYRKLKAENDSLKAQLEIAVKHLQDIRWSWENDAGRQCDNLAYEALEQIQKMRGG